MIQRVANYRLRDSLCFYWIGTAGARLKHAVRDRNESKSSARFLRIGAGNDLQLVVVELAVGNGNKRLMPAPVMPAKHALR